MSDDYNPQIPIGQPYIYDFDLGEPVTTVVFRVGQIALNNIYITKNLPFVDDVYRLTLTADEITLFNNGVQMSYELIVDGSVYYAGPINFIPGNPLYALTDGELNRVLTQYRESPKLLHVIRTYLNKVEDVQYAIKDMPSFFEIETAVGDQLTLLGKRLGWPRCHCVCTVQPVFGFACEGFTFDFPIVGFCDEGSTWKNCGAFGIGTICIDDDTVYRSFLLARRYQILAFYDLESLTDALQTIWGANAWVIDAGYGRVVLSPGRELTVAETGLLQLVPRVLPVAPGIRQRFHFGTSIIFGFGDGWGGFCEEFTPNGLALGTDDDVLIVTEGDIMIGTGMSRPLSADNGASLATEDGDPIITSELTRGADWLCEIDVKPYECA